MKILFSPNCPRICAIRWFGGEKSRFFHEFATQRPCGPQCAPRGRAWPERTASLLLPGADSRPAPAAPRRRSSRRGGLYGRPDRTPTTTRPPGHRGPATAAWGHAAPTRFDEGAAKIGSLFGRIYNPPLRVALPFFVVGAHFICARAAPLQPPWPPVVATRSWRHVGMPPYEVRRGCGGNRGRFRAAIKAAPTTRFRPGP